ncbi:MAG: Bug family tripartite tricarboxylate transporter substrate binding protein [Lautropia sp.]
MSADSMRRRAALAYITGAALAVPAFRAHAQPYPAKPIRLLVPYAPGGAVDIFARLLARELGVLNGQPYVVENKGGAGGALAAAEVARAPADGYTILFGATGPNAIVPAVYGSASGFDPLKDLLPVTALASMPYVLVVHPSLPLRSAGDLLAYARANPGKLNYASSGNGGPDHLAGELFKQLGNVSAVHVPYKGSGPALADLAGGQVQYLFTSPLVAMPFAEAGKVRVIGMTARQRSPSLPDIAAIAEALPGFELSSWYGLFVPAGTPAAIVERINADARRILTSPEFRGTVTKRGVELQASTPEEFGVYVRSEVARWSKVVKDAGIRPE